MEQLKSISELNRRPYFVTNAIYGRKSDTIIFWLYITPTGRQSKYWHTLRFNADRNLSSDRKINKIKEVQNKLTNEKSALIKKGYAVSGPYLYSGTI
jgi:hypothetical protein